MRQDYVEVDVARNGWITEDQYNKVSPVLVRSVNVFVEADGATYANRYYEAHK